MILLIDNYDSFSYNLYQLIGEINPDIKVIRNDEMTVEEIAELAPSHIILSPGPGRPEDAGIIIEAAKTLGRTIPLLGVCLGHQAICAAFGATVTYAKQLMHGKQSIAKLDTKSTLFRGCPQEAPVARYHSLAADAATIPEELIVTAQTADGEVMAVEHREYPIYGVQFHPESILTPDGARMLRNFLKK
ncbi:MAG: aminodeoxychorismate/anthranilate synthase component II [Lachnospiraceae bacterium]|nr:aminodeoxychorismate/anthranilate synthase component II [Lachnospiraceae bacterium]MCR5376918.1 aminodeoxychorismate/anthranilate synthase component II [Lachnospiraceae bacterium]